MPLGGNLGLEEGRATGGPAMAAASSVETCSIRSAMSSRQSGTTKPAPTPSILWVPVGPPDRTAGHPPHALRAPRLRWVDSNHHDRINSPAGYRYLTPQELKVSYDPTWAYASSFRAGQQPQRRLCEIT